MAGFRTRVVILAVVALLTACSAAAGSARHRAPIQVIIPPESSTGPYVAVAVDNHFHDLHPLDYPTISADRPFVIKNEGNNLHNFTVLGTDISVDLRPGHELRWARIGKVLKPGTYNVICTYHLHVGMIGKFVVTPSA